MLKKIYCFPDSNKTQEDGKIFFISDFEDFEGSWLETWKTRVILDILNILHIWFLTWVPNFSFLAWYHYKCVKNPPVIISDLGGHWGFLTGHVENMGHPWSHNCFVFCISNPCAKFQHSSMIISVSRTSCPPWWGVLGGRWGFLTEDLGGQGHPWHHEIT